MTSPDFRYSSLLGLFSLSARTTNGVSSAQLRLIRDMPKGERAAIIPRQVLTLTIYRRGLCGCHPRLRSVRINPEGGPT